MVIVTGSVRVRPEAIDEAVRHSLEHVRRSRREAGCLQHGVYRDAEEPLRLFFYEQWADRDALNAHFAVPASNDFVAAVSALATEPPAIDIHDVG
ncbi:MAG: antibiotic biosynthesis monooxygenase [Actinobacteria bacterium]|nr:antibiotic biosynthesis monooxygenase [Actinomycetota bacterium]